MIEDRNCIEQQDAKKLIEAVGAIKQNDFPTARCLLNEVVANAPENYIYSYEEGDTLFVRFWSEDEFMHFVIRSNGQHLDKKVSWIPAIYPPAYYYLAYIDNEEEKFESALAHLEACLKLEPDQPACLVEMALAYSGMGDHEKALSLFDQAIHARPHITLDVRARALRGKRIELVELGELDLAKKVLIESLYYEPNNEITLNELMFISFLRTGLVETLPSKRLIRKIDSNKRICFSCKKDLATTQSDKFTVMNVENKLIFLCSTCATDESFKNGVEVTCHYASAYFNLGQDLAELGRIQEAAEAFQKAISFKDDYAEAYWGLGWTYIRLERYQESIEAHRKAIQIKPDFAEAHLYLGLTYRRLELPQEAIQVIKKAIQIDPDYLEAHKMLFRVNLDLGNYQEVLEALKQVIRIKPDDAEAHYYLGITYSTLEDYQKAVESFKQAIQMNPNYVEPYSDLGNLYCQLNQYKDAIETLEEAVRLRPDDAELHFNLGTAYGLNGRHREAVESLRLAIHLNPDYAEAYVNLSHSYNILGRHQEAMEACKEAIRINPDLPMAHNNLGEAYLALGNKNAALEEYKILKSLDGLLAKELFAKIHQLDKEGKLGKLYG